MSFIQFEEVNFITLDKKSDPPRLQIDKALLESKGSPYGKTYIIGITLLNQYGLHSSVNFNLKFSNKIVKPIVEQPRNLTVSIVSLDLRGLLVLKFNEAIDTAPFKDKLQMINETLLKIIVVPSKEHASREDFNKSKLDLTWETKTINATHVQI